MQDALTEEERIALQSSRRVTKEMERQWNNAPDAVESDRPDEPSIWRNICKEVWQHDEGRNVVFYKIYSMVASILLVLGVAGTVYFALQDKANVPMYVEVPVSKIWNLSLYQMERKCRWDRAAA